MSSIINPYRFVGEGPAPGGDYVEISTSATVNVDSGDGDYKYIEFDSTTSSAFEVTDAGGSGSDSIEVYCIAGGGGGGCSNALSLVATGSGGGAGGYVRETSFKNGSAGLAQTYDVTIGGGGGAGANTGTVPTAGVNSQLRDTVSRSIEFDGVDDDIVCDDSDAWNFGTGPYTVETWAYIRDDTTSQALISTYDGAYQTPYGWYLGIYGGAYKQFYYYMWSGGWIDIDVEPYLNKWIHIAVCRDSTSADAARFYINGKLKKTFTNSDDYGPVSGVDYDLTLGRYSQHFSSSGWFDGKLASVRISDTARYSSDFSPPFELLENDSNTLLLIQPVSSDSGWVDLSSSPKTLTGSGASQSTDMPTACFGGGRGSYAWGSATGGGDGGSGGGGGSTSHDGGTAGTGVVGQGNDGGTGAYTSPYIYSGGGGAGGVGEDWGDGTGGDGADYSWMFDNSLGFDDGYFAGGGGGGGPDGTSGGLGGGGGGGAGDDEDGYAGETNSGGAGGGAGKTYYTYATSADGGAGGSGKVIIRWKFQN